LEVGGLRLEAALEGGRWNGEGGNEKNRKVKDPPLFRRTQS